MKIYLTKKSALVNFVLLTAIFLLCVGGFSFHIFASIKEKPFFSSAKYKAWQNDLEIRLAKNPERLDLAKVLVHVATLNEDFQVAIDSLSMLLKKYPRDSELRLDEIRLLRYLHRIEDVFKKVDSFLQDFPDHSQATMLKERRVVMERSQNLPIPKSTLFEILPVEEKIIGKTPTLKSVYSLKQPGLTAIFLKNKNFIYDEKNQKLFTAFELLNGINDKTLKKEDLINQISFYDFQKMPHKLIFDFDGFANEAISAEQKKNTKKEPADAGWQFFVSADSKKVSPALLGWLENMPAITPASLVGADIKEDQKINFANLFNIESIHYTLNEEFIHTRVQTYSNLRQPVEVVDKESLTILKDHFCREFSVDPFQRFMIAACLDTTAPISNYNLLLFVRKNNVWVLQKNQSLKNVNSEYHERFPNISSDGRYLFYSSNGQASYGGFDIYSSQIRYRDAQGNLIKDEIDLQAGVNLSAAINSYHEEYDRFDLQPDQDRLLIKRLFAGDLNILQAKGVANLPTLPKITNTIPVKFKVLSESGSPLFVDLELIPTKNDLRAPLVSYFTKESPYLYLTADAEYTVKIRSRGYFYNLFRLSFDTALQKEINTGVIKYIFLKEIKLNSSVVASGILFEKRSAEINPGMQAELEAVSTLMKENPSIVLMIEGHTDNVGGDDYNLELSNQRAASVKNELIKKGIPEKRLLAKGFGQTRPVASNDTETGKAKNRRTEFKVHELK